jgi:hypothetical protein
MSHKKIIEYITQNKIYDPVKIYQKFKHDGATLKDITFVLLMIDNDVTDECTVRPDQKTYRSRLVDRYNTCVITDINESRCEACHIFPFSESDNIQKYDIDNGLLLRRDLHPLFDKYQLSINPQTQCVEIKPNVIEYDIEQFNGKKINNLSKNTLKYLNQHYDKFLNQIL